MFGNLKTKNNQQSVFKNSEPMRNPFSRAPGTDSSVTKTNEGDRLCRCRVCGFICDRERDISIDDGKFAGLGIQQGSQLTAGSSIGDIRYSKVPFVHFKCNDNAASTVVTDDGVAGGKDGIASTNTSNLAVPGKIGNGFEFNGSTEYININTLLAAIVSDTVGTFSFWIEPDDAGNSTVFSATNASDATTYFIIAQNQSKLWLTFDVAGTRRWEASTGANTIPANTYIHVAIVHNGTAVKIYLNGAEVTLSWGNAITPTAWFSALTGGNTARVGVKTVGATSSSYFDGEIDDFRYYQTVLTELEISSLYNDGNGTEGTIITKSDKYYDRTVSGGCPCCGSYLFDPAKPVATIPELR